MARRDVDDSAVVPGRNLDQTAVRVVSRDDRLRYVAKKFDVFAVDELFGKEVSPTKFDVVIKPILASESH